LCIGHTRRTIFACTFVQSSQEQPLTVSYDW